MRPPEVMPDLFGLNSVASWKPVSVIVAPRRIAPTRFVPDRIVCERSDPERFAPARSARDRLARCRLRWARDWPERLTPGPKRCPDFMKNRLGSTDGLPRTLPEATATRVASEKLAWTIVAPVIVA